jgi:hypothetical protein
LLNAIKAFYLNGGNPKVAKKLFAFEEAKKPNVK